MACHGTAHRARNHNDDPAQDHDRNQNTKNNNDTMKANGPNSWETHMPKIRQLYMDEGKTLKEVMEIMQAEHGFTASVKVYKQRLKKSNARKNIRLGGTPGGELDYAMLVHALSGSNGSRSARTRSGRNSSSTMPSTSASRVAMVTTSATTPAVITDSSTPPQHPASEIQLATGQVVDVGRLAMHLRRKRTQARYYAQRTAATATTMRIVRPPKSFYECEAVLDSTRSYIFGRFKDLLITEASIDASRTLNLAVRRWNRFLFTVRGPLCSPARFSEALVLMRQAPDELRSLLAAQPAALLSSLFMFIVCMARCLVALGSSDQARQFSGVVKALLRYAAWLTATTGTLDSSVETGTNHQDQDQYHNPNPAGESPRYTPRHPVSRLLQSLTRVEDDQLYPVVVQAWKLSCQSWDEIAVSSSSTSATFDGSRPPASPSSPSLSCCSPPSSSIPTLASSPSSLSSSSSPSSSPPTSSDALPSRQPSQLHQPSRAPICSTTASDWINFATLVPEADIPPHVPAAVSQTLLALQRRASATTPAAVNALWGNAVLIELTVAEGTLPSPDLHFFLANNVLYDQWTQLWRHGRITSGRHAADDGTGNDMIEQGERLVVDDGVPASQKIGHLYLGPTGIGINNVDDIEDNYHQIHIDSRNNNNEDEEEEFLGTNQHKPDEPFQERNERNKVMLMRSFEDAVRGLQFIHSLENAFWAWGNREKTEQMAEWRAELTGDL